MVRVDRPAAQDAGAHGVLALYRRHAPPPSQNPSVPQLAAPWSAHRESTLPLAVLLHTPSDAVSAHDLQIPVQAVSQQTPCSQKFDRHSSFFVQSAPLGLRPQDPFTHTAGG